MTWILADDSVCSLFARMPDFIAASINSKIASPSPSRNVRARQKRDAKEFSQQKVCLHVPVGLNLNHDEKQQQLNIPRARLTRDFVQGLIKDDSNTGGKYVAQYLVSNDKDGSIVQLDRMQSDCRTRPTSYTVVTKADQTRPSINQDGGNSPSLPIVVRRSDGQHEIHTKGGVYCGQVDQNDKPSGSGKMECRNGDVITGSFSINTTSIAAADVVDMETNPYARGLPHGRSVTISFADGSIYEGEMKDGNVTGHGVYVNAMGDRYEGTFKLGLLLEGKIVYASGEVAEGRFSRGENLHGFAKWSDSGREISGHFENGLLNGKATVVYKDGEISSHFRGFFHEGRRHHRGILYTGKSSDNAINGVTIEGPWMSDLLLVGGRMHNTATGKSCPTYDKVVLPRDISKSFHTDECFASARATAIEGDTMIRMKIQEKNCKAFDKAFRKRLSRSTRRRERNNSHLQ
jgi:hypothetical protein